MSTDLRGQLDAYFADVDDSQTPITSTEVLGIQPSPTSRDSRGDSEPKVRWGRKLWAFAGGAGLVMLIGVLPALLPAETGAEPASDLGFFEPLSSRIVVVHGGALEAINPENPSSVVTIEIPDLPPVPDGACASFSSGPCDDGALSLMPVGWSSDGTLMALQSEHAGMYYTLDTDGEITRLPLERVEAGGGCCLFVTSNWLSPDGKHAAFGKGLGLAIVDLVDTRIESEAQLDPDEFPGREGWGQIYLPAWSPDGSRVAFVAARYENSSWTHVIQVYNRTDETIIQLPIPDFGHVRNLAWSPNGTELLVVTGELVLTERNTTWNNPLASSLASSLVVVDVDGGHSEAIGEGRFVVAAWSPDGTQIAAIDGFRDLVVMNADGSDQRTIADMTGYGYDNLFTGVTWHPGR